MRYANNTFLGAMRCAKATFHVERLSDLEQEGRPLLEMNWAEVAGGYPGSALRPDWETYRLLEASQALRIVTARVEDKLVGYAAILVHAHPHRTDDRVGTVDSLFVLPEYRSRGTATGLLEEAQAQLKRDGVVSLAVAARSEKIARWLDMHRFRKVEMIYERSL
jgi:GNAT superfamily N-acetyltransferase